MDSKTSQPISPSPIAQNHIAVVAFPIAVPGIYDYAIPDQLIEKLTPGTPVLVPLRKRETWGVVVGMKASSAYTDLKSIITIQTDRWSDSGSMLLKLYEWIADYYQCDLGRVFKPLIRKGVMKSKPKTVTVYSAEDRKTIERLNDKYRTIFQKLSTISPFTIIEALEKLDVTRASVNYLFKNGFLNQSQKTILREAFELRIATPSNTISLTDEQRDAVRQILTADPSTRKPFLLFGITGSGKTLVYIEIAAEMIRKGKGIIILVPEISLTPQTIQRFKSALGDVLTVIHSNMSDGERRDSLQELVTGKKRVVIGVRSAVLAPVDQLGCIIVDEEHDGSYKQSDIEPRYHARDVAVMRAKLQNALVVLGSATPSFESYNNALTGKYSLIRLSQRFGAAALPRVTTIDMREEQQANNWTPLSRQLTSAITSTLQNNRQIILLLNRRGFSTVLLCQECGYTAYCPECSVTLRYHRADTSLKCHVCGYIQQAPTRCPTCRGEKIKYKGTGIQKVEEHLRETFPQARILRMDQDSTRKKGAHAMILGQFAEHKADILLGTQMVAKGLNFPGVALVGVIAADTGLHIPDFRASERTFQLLTQVAGRAGRADNTGEVIIQTYCPDDSAIKCTEKHDYETFFNLENDNRKQLFYPPHSRLVRMVIEGINENDVHTYSKRLASQLRILYGDALDLLGPAPAVLERISNEVRYTILLKLRSFQKCGSVLKELRKMNQKLPGSLKIIIDVDPVNML